MFEQEQAKRKLEGGLVVVGDALKLKEVFKRVHDVCYCTRSVARVQNEGESERESQAQILPFVHVETTVEA